MVLEAVVFPSSDPFSHHTLKDTTNNLFLFDDDSHLQQHNPSSLDFLQNNHLISSSDWDYCFNNNNDEVYSLSYPSSSDTTTTVPPPPPPAVVGRPSSKRRRPKSRKNEQEIETQRMTHIAVERNRRKQMNHYLSLLRSLMPHSYVQRGDQASIVGGAINFVKELEQRLQFLASHHKQTEATTWEPSPSSELPFSEFFTFPQYSSSAAANPAMKSCSASSTSTSTVGCDIINKSGAVGEGIESSGIADIEVTMVESHANLKIRSKKRPKQLLKLVSALHSMRLTILHLNVTTTNQVVLYSLSVKVEDDCKLGSVDDIAAALFQMMDTIHQEALLC